MHISCVALPAAPVPKEHCEALKAEGGPVNPIALSFDCSEGYILRRFVPGTARLLPGSRVSSPSPPRNSVLLFLQIYHRLNRAKMS